MDAGSRAALRRTPRFRFNAICEVTVNAKGAVIRGLSPRTCTRPSTLASDKVARQLRKYKTRIVERRGR